MIHAFLLAYQFPPLNVGGSHRWARLSRHLRDQGVEVTIFTLDLASPGSPYADAPMDASLLDGLPEDLRVIRVPCDESWRSPTRGLLGKAKGYFRLAAGEGRAWKPYVRRAVLAEAAISRPDVLTVTAPPFSMAPLGAKLAAELAVPLVLDMRDPWSTWAMAGHATYAHFVATVAAERRCFRAASAIVFTAPQTRTDMIRLHPSLPAAKLHVITNGHEGLSASHAPRESRHFTIGYVGSFYFTPEQRTMMMSSRASRKGHRKLRYIYRREDWKYRSPWFFFRAIHVLLERRPDLAEQLRVRILSADTGSEWLSEMVEAWGLGNVVALEGAVEHKQALEFEQGCDALLITASKIEGGKSYSIAGKTYEYLSQLKPILAFTPPGAQRDILEPSGLAVLCDPDDADASSRKLEDLVTGRGSVRPRMEFINSLHASELAKSMSSLLHDVVGRAAPA